MKSNMVMPMASVLHSLRNLNKEKWVVKKEVSIASISLKKGVKVNICPFNSHFNSPFNFPF